MLKLLMFVAIVVVPFITGTPLDGQQKYEVTEKANTISDDVSFV